MAAVQFYWVALFFRFIVYFWAMAFLVVPLFR